MTHVYPISGFWQAAGAAEMALQLEAMEVGRMGRAGLDSFRKKQGRELESLIRPRSTYHRRPTSRFAPPEEFFGMVTAVLISHSVKRDTLRGMSPYARVQVFFQAQLNLVTPEVRNYLELGYVGVGKGVGQPLTEVEFAQLALERLNSLMTILKLELRDGPFHRQPLLYDAALFLFHLFQEAEEAEMDLIELAGSAPDASHHLAALARENLDLLGKIIEGTPYK